MIKQKLLRINQGPDDVLVSLAFGRHLLLLCFAFSLLFDVTQRRLKLLWLRLPGVGRQIEVAHFLRVGIAAVSAELRGVAFIRGDLFLKVLRVQQMQTLGQTGALRAFALAGGRSFRPAKNGQKIRAGVESIVRKLQRPNSGGQPVKFGLRFEDLIHRIEQDFRPEAPRIKSRKIVSIRPVVFIGHGAQLVSRRSGDRVDELLKVIAAADKVPGQRVEQLLVGRGVGVAHIVLGIDQAAAKEMFPISIDQRAREETILF